MEQACSREGELILREYQAADLDAMFVLDCVCFAEVYRFSRRAMRGFAEARGAISLVAVEKDDFLAGFVIAQRQGPARRRYGYVVTLDVAPEWRRRGLAKRLMAKAERGMEEQGADTMVLHVSTENEAAWRFYEKTGYERVGVEADFYAKGMDAFLYVKPVGSAMSR